MSKQELLPCPFCGGKADMEYSGDIPSGGHEHQSVTIECASCEASCSVHPWPNQDISCSCCNDITSIVVERWNRRVSISSEEEDAK